MISQMFCLPYAGGSASIYNNWKDKFGKDLVHFSYGMVNLPNGKMKSREGTVVDADELIAQMIADAKATADEHGQSKDFSEEEKAEIARIVGLGALKYFILKVDARKNMLFNPEESIDFNGNTGPFIQYTYARIESILRKAGEQNITIPAQLGDDAPLNDKEIELIQKLNDFGVAVADAAVFTAAVMGPDSGLFLFSL